MVANWIMWILFAVALMTLAAQRGWAAFGPGPSLDEDPEETARIERWDRMNDDAKVRTQLRKFRYHLPEADQAWWDENVLRPLTPPADD